MSIWLLGVKRAAYVEPEVFELWSNGELPSVNQWCLAKLGYRNPCDGVNNCSAVSETGVGLSEDGHLQWNTLSKPRCGEHLVHTEASSEPPHRKNLPMFEMLRGREWPMNCRSLFESQERHVTGRGTRVQCCQPPVSLTQESPNKAVKPLAYGSLGRSALRACSGMASPLLPDQSLHAERRLPWR